MLVHEPNLFLQESEGQRLCDILQTARGFRDISDQMYYLRIETSVTLLAAFLQGLQPFLADMQTFRAVGPVASMLVGPLLKDEKKLQTRTGTSIASLLVTTMQHATSHSMAREQGYSSSTADCRAIFRFSFASRPPVRLWSSASGFYSLLVCHRPIVGSLLWRRRVINPSQSPENF